MKTEILVLGVLTFFAMDTYHDGKYTKQIGTYKKHLKIGGMVFAAFSMYIFLKRNPSESINLMSHVSSAIRYMPIDKNSKDLISPFLTSAPEQRILSSGDDRTGRSVSGTKKKYVAAAQGWKCNGCQKSLDAWYEVDHKVRLADGGSNHISNLVALCRNCHGQKTMLETLD